MDIEIKAEDDGAVYTCQADNNLTFTSHDSITLDIRCKSSPAIDFFYLADVTCMFLLICCDYFCYNVQHMNCKSLK